MNLIDIPVYRMSQMLSSREISPSEVVDAYLNRIESTEGRIRAFITLLRDQARSRAREAERRIASGENVKPLTGIPIVLKDNMCTRGVRTTCSSKILENFVPPYDATVVRKLNDAGMVLLGKTNMDEFAMGSSTENSRFFTTKNPWDINLVPGGSSGGSAAAVASRETPLALGSDTGGSVRQPASFCGVTGMKPTYGAVSRYGLIAFASSLDQIGPLGRSVLDIALLMDEITGHDPLDSTSVPFSHPEYYRVAVEGESLKGMKFGLPREFFGSGLDPAIRECLEESRKTMESLGAEFVEVSLPALDYALAAYYVIAPSEASSNLARYDGCRYGYRDPDTSSVEAMSRKTRREGFGMEVLRRIMIGTYCLSSGYYDAYYLKAQKVRTLIKRDFDRAFEQCDMIFSPATPTTAFGIGEKADDPLAMYLSDIYTVSVNMAGLPGLVFPCGFSNGLPVGLQLIGKPFADGDLLRAGAVFQGETDFHTKFPE